MSLSPLARCLRGAPPPRGLATCFVFISRDHGGCRVDSEWGRATRGPGQEARAPAAAGLPLRVLLRRRRATAGKPGPPRAEASHPGNCSVGLSSGASAAADRRAQRARRGLWPRRFKRRTGLSPGPLVGCSTGWHEAAEQPTRLLVGCTCEVPNAPGGAPEWGAALVDRTAAVRCLAGLASQTAHAGFLTCAWRMALPPCARRRQGAHQCGPPMQAVLKRLAAHHMAGLEAFSHRPSAPPPDAPTSPPRPPAKPRPEPNSWGRRGSGAGSRSWSTPRSAARRSPLCVRLNFCAFTHPFNGA